MFVRVPRLQNEDSNFFSFHSGKLKSTSGICQLLSAFLCQVNIPPGMVLHVITGIKCCFYCHNKDFGVRVLLLDLCVLEIFHNFILPVVHLKSSKKREIEKEKKKKRCRDLSQLSVCAPCIFPENASWSFEFVLNCYKFLLIMTLKILLWSLEVKLWLFLFQGFFPLHFGLKFLITWKNNLALN